MIEHKVTHYYQPTNHSCSQSALAILLSFFGKSLTPEEIVAKIPVNKNDKGEDWGTINQQLATWCLSQGFEVEMHTADFEIIDLSWAKLTKEKLLERMELAKNLRDVPALGKEWSKIYTQSYIDFLEAGGQLHIRPYMTTELLDSLLPDSPLLLCVCYNVLYGSGRSKDVGLRKSETDDLNGKLTNHSIVIYGKDKDGNYLIADPYKEPGLHTIEPERMLAAMTAAQMECDNLLFQLKQGE
ncbi:hypothetical protein IPF89_02425 [Candidatus Saccharibacteria bacterium]|nr:MAG: hypothetical protein IPF89_02425 [Candidatus Saccharibacteria bacterium]